MIRSIDKFMDAYQSGQRLFRDLEFENGESFKGLNLSGSTFQNCWFAADFTDTDLRGCKFLNCNLKTSDFTGADLRNALIKECSLESTIFPGARTENLVFENNYCYGVIVQQEDLGNFLKN